ncbi:hypothetical protein QOT17_017317 [Balamuthia mandrillaris]
MGRTGSTFCWSVSVVVLAVDLYYILSTATIAEQVSVTIPAPRDEVFAFFATPRSLSKYQPLVTKTEEHKEKDGTHSYTVHEAIPIAFNFTFPSSVRVYPTKDEEKKEIRNKIVGEGLVGSLLTIHQSFQFEDVNGKETIVRDKLEGNVLRLLSYIVTSNWRHAHTSMLHAIKAEFQHQQQR